MSTVAYEDMSDWIRRLPGLYPMDYGVVGAPVLFRPWNAQPWLIGVERDGIPWHRVSDGLYDSNLDSPEGVKSLSLRFDGTSPFGTLDLRSRMLPSDSTTTEVVLREGYYGFGRIDFAQAQQLSKSVSAEARGRLFWYDGLRLGISKSRFYNMSGRIIAQLSDQWRGSLEYGGTDVDAQAPVAFRVDNIFQRPQVYSEREYATAKLNRMGQSFRWEFGLHARQDRETRGSYFGLREKFWYGYAQGDFSKNKSTFGTRAAVELSDFSFPGIDQRSENALSLKVNAGHDLGILKADLRGLYRQRIDVKSRIENQDVYPDESIWLKLESKRVAGLSVQTESNFGYKSVPQFWRYAKYPLAYRELPVDERFFGSSYYGGTLTAFEPRHEINKVGMMAGGINLNRGTSNATIKFTRIAYDKHSFTSSGDTLDYFPENEFLSVWHGVSLDCDVALTSSFRLQSWTSVETDEHDFTRALDTRAFTRLLISRDFFKAPLHITSYVAHEMIGKHDAVSDYASYDVGPTHMLHFRVEGTIEGVTLIWGAENLTGQHYEYLPGYVLISKEEYFGLRWTFKL